MKKINECPLCKNKNLTELFCKKSDLQESFQLVKCQKCGLQFLNPQPEPDEIIKYYSGQYFTKRTDRGYNNYFSNETQKIIENTFKLNLKDLGFYKFEKKLPSKKTSLDIGCAAGYFVNILKKRNWQAQGIDIASQCLEFAEKKLNLTVTNGNYLETQFNNKFDLITLWATIEHLQNPELFLNKIHTELNNSGKIYISTCRIGGANFMKHFGSKWRFYNFPEHLIFYSKKNIKQQLAKCNFETEKIITYGSGIGKSGSVKKKVADFLAKKFNLGDMMIIVAHKK